jgi:hypothetical protein
MTIPVTGKTHDEFIERLARRQSPIEQINIPAAITFIGPKLSESRPANVPTIAIDIAPEAKKKPI